MFITFIIFILVPVCTLVECHISKFQTALLPNYHYHDGANGWMKLHRVPATFHDARLRCQLEGAILASPINEHLESAMKSEMQNNELNWNTVFTGVHATFSKGDFFSIEGVPLDNLPVEWSLSEPNNRNNDEDCITYSSNGTIADVSCDQVHPYICYRKKTGDIKITICGTEDDEYKFEPTTGSCYKFHKVPKNWTQAFMTCVAEGSYLAIVNSVAEAKVIKEMFKRYPVNSVLSKLLGVMKDNILIGYLDWGETGIWTTIYGSTLKEAGYDTWDEDQPNNTSPGQYCGGITSNGKLNDIWCERKGRFICEKTVKLGHVKGR